MPKPDCDRSPVYNLLEMRWGIERDFWAALAAGLEQLPRIIDECSPEAAGRLIIELTRLHLGLKLPNPDGPECVQCYINDVSRGKDPLGGINV